MHDPALLTLLDDLIDASGGPDACHPWRGPLHKRGTPYYCFHRNYNPRRVLFEELHETRLETRYRVNSRCPGMLCCNPRHMWGGPLALRLHTLLDKSGGPDACWLFLGVTHEGYGRIGVRRGERYFAHRVAYELAHGPIEGHQAHTENEKVVMHTCDNPPCCNPKHLRVGTDADNIHDMMRKGRHPVLREHHIRRASGDGLSSHSGGTQEP